MTDNKVYEIRDVTDDEMFYQVGFFLDKSEAEKALKEIDIDACQAYHNDYADFELVEFEIGFHAGRYKVVSKASYKKLCDDDDEYIWELQ